MLSIQGYQVSELIYESNNSIVYRGKRQTDGLPVILKMLRQDYPSSEALNRYQQEYKITKSLDILGVIKVYSLQKYQNTLVIILEDFGGKALKTLSKLPIEHFLPLSLQMTESLGHLHKADIIHKDINPSNIVWNQSEGQLKIIDFGISSRLPRENPTLKNPEKLEGTLPYISPEQTGRMNRSLDYRTDLYSLGVTFYELLTGKLPFEAESSLELVHCHIAKTPKPIYEVNPDVPEVVSDIVMKLMAKNVEDRYQSAFGVKADLEKCTLQLANTSQIVSFQLAQNDFSGKLQIPQKLYGRENEVNTLLQTFERVSLGKTEMMLVAGYSGVGKTALVHEVHKSMTEKRGYFTAGKFDQFQKNIPYSAITQAFNEFCRYLLMENTGTLANWQTRILDAVGNNGQIIIDVIPDLELVIGSQPKVIEVGPTEAQNRFQIFFLNFIKALCDKNHPFILFIDDLQWVDSASLRLLKSIMLDGEVQHLLIIGAYRDNEVGSSHPFIMTLDELQKAHVSINTIELHNLQLTNINQLLQDSLKCEAQLSQPLTDLIHQKTQGNAFFTHQFLHTLYQEALLQFDFKQRQWQWDVKQIAGQNITANVVELMANKIDKLPSNTSAVLQLAACMGNQFDLSILAIIYEQTQNETLAALAAALIEGLVQPLNDNYKQLKEVSQSQFKFLHDRVQQAAYTLIEDEHKQTIHLKIGRLLLENAPTDILEEKIFDIVGQFNSGIELINNQVERLKVAELNLIAGQKAKAATAYGASVNYLKEGLKCLSKDCWQTNYELTLNLYVEIVEVEFLHANFEQTKKLAQMILQQAKTLLDKLKVYEVLIQFYMAKNEIKAALDTALQVLEMLGVNLEKAPPKQLEIEHCYTLPEMTAPDKLAAMRILNFAISPSYTVAPELFPQIVFTMVKLSAEHGNSALSVFGYSTYGLLLCAALGEVEAGYQAGQLAINLLEKFNAKELKAKGFAAYNAAVHHWKKHARETIAPLIEGSQSGLETGDLEFAGVTAMHCSSYLFWVGEPLETVAQQQKKFHTLLKNIRQEYQLLYVKIWQQAVFNLQGLSAEPCRLIGEAFNEDEILPSVLETNYGLAAFGIYLSKSVLYYLFKDFTQSVANAVLAEEHEQTNVGVMVIPIHKFYYSLALLATYPTALPDKQSQIIHQVEANQKKMEMWAFHAPMNYQHKYDLVEAEKARILGQLNAIEWYEKAIAGAEKHEYLQEEALAYELAAQFYLERDMEKIAQTYLKEAHYRYQQWGAIAKVTDLEEHYPQWLIQKNTQSTSTNILTHTSTATILASTGTHTSTSQLLDLESVMKAAQTLSGEIVLNQLLEKMMRIVIENAGAERGFLILPYEDRWVIEAESAIDKEEIITLQSLPVGNHLPEVIINYVARTHENVVLTDASREGLYTQTPYIKTHQTQSVLCFPIVYQQQLRAILYFENNLTMGAFTQHRLNVLTILSSQIAISLENARFVEDLEIARRQAEIANQTKTAFLANVSHELRTPLNAILGYVQLFNRDASLSKAAQEGSQLIEQSGKYLLTLINDIIDISTVETGKTTISSADIRFDTFLNNLIDIFRHRAQEKSLKLHHVFSPELPLGISSDEKRLRQILTHLLSNAVKFTQQGEITFTVMSHQNKICFQIADTGCGIIPENLGKIFLPFEQISDWKHKSEGAGLGLSLVKKLVEALDGEIQVESQIDQGSCFKVDVPLVESIEWRGKISDLLQVREEAEQFEEYAEDSNDEVTLEEIIPLLSAEQIAMLYHSSMTGDVKALLKQADDLELLTSEFAPLIDKIRQTAKDYDTDPIADLLEPFIEG